MPFYHFKIVNDGIQNPQPTGLELADYNAAWDEAANAAGELIKSIDGKPRPGSEWSMDVTDDGGKLLQ